MGTKHLSDRMALLRQARDVAVLVVALSCCGVMPAQAADAEKGKSSSVLKVVSYNVQFLPAGASIVNKRKDPEYRARTLARRLAAYDIIGLNETFHDKHREILMGEFRKTIGEGCSILIAPQPTDGRFNSGLAIVSPLPFLETHVLTYSVGSSPRQYGIFADGFAAKGALHARVARGATRQSEFVDVFVPHLDSKDAQVRQVQYEELGKFVGQHSDAKQPTLIMGDMNTRGNPPYMQNPSSAYHIMLASYQKGRPGAPIIDLWPHLNSGQGGTGEPGDQDHSGRIDYILLSNPVKGGCKLEPLTARVNPFLDDRVVSLSDHSAVEAELRWRSR